MTCQCGSDYFGSQPIVQTASDGRVFGHFAEIVTPFVMLLTCAKCGRRWIYPDHMRSGGKLVEPGTPEAEKLLAEDRVDFAKSMDQRQEKRV